MANFKRTSKRYSDRISGQKSFSSGCVDIFNPSVTSFSGMSGLTASKLISKNKTWVYTSADKNATTVSSALLRLYSVTDSVRGQKKPLVPYRDVSHKELSKLSARTQLKANPLLDSTLSVEQIFRHPALDLLDSKNRQQFFYLIQSYMELTGNAYVLIKSDSFGIPEDLMLIPSQLVKPKIDGDTIKYFVQTPMGAPVELPYKDVIHFKRPNPANPSVGLAPLVAIVESQELYESMQLYEFALNKNSAIPAFIVKYLNGSLNKQDRKKMEADWNRSLRGINKAGSTKVIDEDVSIENLGISPKDMNYLKGKKWIREEIAGAFGVPLSLLTTENVNLANAVAAEKTYNKYTIVPRLNLIESTLNAHLIPRYESGDRLFFAYDSLDQEDKEFKLKEVTELFKAGIINQDQAMSLYGLDIE